MTKQFSNYSDLLTFTRASKGHALRPVSYGAELVTNGDFSDTDLSDWTSANQANTVSVVNSALRVTASVSSNYGIRYQAITTTVGKIYKASVDILSGTADARLLVGNTATSGSIFIGSSPYSDVTHETVFVATADTTYVSLQLVNASSGEYADFDNISLKEVTFDESDGTLTLFEHPVNVPRVEYDADGNRLGLLVEESRTNLVTHSQDFDNSSWDAFASSISANTATAPDGTVTADTLSEDTSSNYRYVSDALGAISANWTFSAFVKKKDDDIQIQLRPIGVGSGKAFATFDPADGSLLYSGGTNLVSTSTTNVGNGWHRISMTVDLALTSASHGVMLVLVAGQSTEFPSYTGTGKGVYIWGAQVEASASFPTSYIKSNSGSTTTRSADVASIPVADFGFNADAGSFLIEATLQDFGGVSVPVMFSDGTSNERFYARVNNNPYHLSLVAISGGTTQANVDSNVDAVFGQTFVFAGAIKKDDFSVSVDGQTAVTDTSGLSPSGITKVNFGSDHANTLNMQGHIKSIKYYPRRLTNAQLQDLTS